MKICAVCGLPLSGPRARSPRGATASLNPPGHPGVSRGWTFDGNGLARQGIFVGPVPRGAIYFADIAVRNVRGPGIRVENSAVDLRRVQLLGNDIGMESVNSDAYVEDLEID